MAPGKVSQFFSRNAVAIVMIPAIIGIHWGWNKIQENDIFVSKAEKKDLPIILGARFIEEKLQEKIVSLKGGDNIAPEK